MYRMLLVSLLILNCASSFAQQPAQPLLPHRWYLQQISERANQAPKPSWHSGARTTTGAPIFDTTRWAHLIDSTWGPGMPTAQKLSLFNTFWNRVDSLYSCFVNLPMYNWDSVVNAMRTEISGGVSRGRFAGITSQLSRMLNDGHTQFTDITVELGYPYPGMPVFSLETGGFGACLTMLADSSSMVYSAEPTQPFGLAPGDIILGYNGIRWTTLIDIMLRHQLPGTALHRSSQAANYHYYIQSAGENWYLFDTINIRKCDGSIVNYPTSWMTGMFFYNNLCTEEPAIPGIHHLTFTDYITNGRIISSGVITGTRIGYVALLDCSDMTGDSLYNATKALVEDSLVAGLIFDIRTNYGGSYGALTKTFEYLNNGDVNWLGGAWRTSYTNRYTMATSPAYTFMDGDSHHFDNKIAILEGPGAISAGDFMQVLYHRHPMVKIFGKHTAGAFGAFSLMSTPYSDYRLAYQSGNFFDSTVSPIFLSHSSYPIDSQVWFSRHSICAGTDTILNTAIRWIMPTLSTAPAPNTISAKAYPNPASTQINTLITSAEHRQINLQLIDMTGRIILTRPAEIEAGDNKVSIDLVHLSISPGVYQLKISGPGVESVSVEVSVVR